MKTEKIELSDDAIEFLSDIMKEENISIKDAIVEWNKKQEVRKFLKVGDIVKIRRQSVSDLNRKKGFIGAVLSPCGMGFDLDRSGKFSVYLFEYHGSNFQADLLGFELEPTGNMISKEFLEDYIKNIPIHDSMHEELEKAMQEI